MHEDKYEKILSFLRREGKLGASASMISRSIKIKKLIVDEIMAEMCGKGLCVSWSVPKPTRHIRYFIEDLRPKNEREFIDLYEIDVHFARSSSVLPKKKHPQRKTPRDKILEAFQFRGPEVSISDIASNREDNKAIDKLCEEGTLIRIGGKLKLAQTA